MEFVDAVRTLCGENALILFQSVARLRTAEGLSAAGSELLRYSHRVVLAALGIDSEIISRCMKAGIFYKSRNYHNCVFVGKEKAGKAPFACMRGTNGRLQGRLAGKQ